MTATDGSTVGTLGSQVYPSLEDFQTLAASHRVVPIWTTLLADLTTPVAAFMRLCGDDETGQPGFLLESVDHGGQWGRWSFVGRNPQVRLVSHGATLTVDGEVPTGLSIDTSNGVLHAIETLTNHFQAPTAEELGNGAEHLPPLHSGVVGFLGYDIVREVENLPDAPHDATGWPDAIVSVIHELAAYDHWTQQATLIASAFIPEGSSEQQITDIYNSSVGRLTQMSLDGATPIDEPLVSTPQTGDVPEVSSTLGAGQFERAVEVAKDYIRTGDVFQVVLSQRFETEISADPLDVYRVLRRVNPSPYMYYVREPELTLVGCSPEPMVQVLDGRVISRPIAGTRYRGKNDEHDRRLAAELMEHPKERAEHIMLVDLARNDIGRVVEFGSCEVDELMTLERYSHVMHLTSQVSGVLDHEKSSVDVLRATLPAGTVSGAPKVRAMEVIDELEPVRRGPYAGVVGYIDFSGQVDTAIAIRTMIIDPPGSNGLRRATVQAGAGVVADSDPAEEELETRNKAKALLVALPAAEAMTAARRAAMRTTTSSASSTASASSTQPLSLADLRASIAGIGVNVAHTVAVVGPDALQLLHSQASQELQDMADGESRMSLLLEPQGKLNTWLRAIRINEQFWILDPEADLVDASVEHDVVAALQERIARFKLRADVTITPLPVVRIRIRNSSDAEQVQATLQTVEGVHTVVVPNPWNASDNDTLHVDLIAIPETTVQASQPGSAGDVFGQEPALDWAQQLSNVLREHLRADLDQSDLRNLQILQGWPTNGVDTGATVEPETIPAELGQWVIDSSVSFTKGCYTGQELVARVDSRGGNTPRNLRLVLVPGAAATGIGDALIQPGNAVVAVDDAETVLGTCSSSTVVRGVTVALVYMKRAARGIETVATIDGVIGTVVSLEAPIEA